MSLTTLYNKLDSFLNKISTNILNSSWFSKPASCDPFTSGSSVLHFVKRADTDKLRKIFAKYASVEKNGECFMTSEDFIIKFLGLITDVDNYNVDTVKLLANVVDTTKDGLISFVEFQSFEGQLCASDSLYALAFQIFDKNSNGRVNFDEFFDVLRQTDLQSRIPFDFNSHFILLHFGKNKQRNVTYTEFTKLLHDFYDEHALQAFSRYDLDNSGLISAMHFYDIMTSLKKHLLTKIVKDNLITVAGVGQRTKHVSYPYFIACITLLNNMELIKQIYNSAAKGDPEVLLTKEEMMHEAQKFTQITPLEIEILFQIVSVISQTGKLKLEDIKKMAPLDEEMLPIHYQELAMQEQDRREGRGVLMQVMESGYRFLLGSIAGAVGATAVYPIDLVKTRLQNQRTGSYIGERLYKNSFDCFKKVIRHEGFFGLYRGLLPQLVGVAPEKAIKLTVNDFIRDKLSMADGSIPIYAEIISGGCAGGSQVIFTNPLEIVKIRLQIAGELAMTARLGAMDVIKELGFFGLYKGAPACFARDIPFSAIFFPLYAHLKSLFSNKDNYNTIPSLLLSATMAGVPAAALVTPADVVKTRLQVVARQGQTTYKGPIDCAVKIFREEGFNAFWKGAPARVFRSSPQFGVTLATYEILQRAFSLDFGGRKLSGSQKGGDKSDNWFSIGPTNPDHIGGYRLALAAFEGIETKFGLSFPKFRTTSSTSTPPDGAVANKH